MLFPKSQKRDIFEKTNMATLATTFVEGGGYYIYIPKSKVKNDDYSEAIQNLLPTLKNGWKIELGEMQSDDPSKPKVFFITHKKA